MNLKRLSRAALVLSAGVWLSASAVAQEPPRPGPEHKILEMDVGTWDATVDGLERVYEDVLARRAA